MPRDRCRRVPPNGGRLAGLAPDVSFRTAREAGSAVGWDDGARRSARSLRPQDRDAAGHASERGGASGPQCPALSRQAHPILRAPSLTSARKADRSVRGDRFLPSAGRLGGHSLHFCGPETPVRRSVRTSRSQASSLSTSRSACATFCGSVMAANSCGAATTFTHSARNHARLRLAPHPFQGSGHSVLGPVRCLGHAGSPLKNVAERQSDGGERSSSSLKL